MPKPRDRNIILSPDAAVTLAVAIAIAVQFLFRKSIPVSTPHLGLRMSHLFYAYVYSFKEAVLPGRFSRSSGFFVQRECSGVELGGNWIHTLILFLHVWSTMAYIPLAPGRMSRPCRVLFFLFSFFFFLFFPASQKPCLQPAFFLFGFWDFWLALLRSM